MANWLDKIVGFFSPRAATERLAHRMAYQELESYQTRAYDAGHGGRLNANWRAVNMPADLEDSRDRDIVRARARDLENNSDVMNAVIYARRRNIIGAGYQLQARTPSERLNTQLEDLWAQWTKAKNCDVTGCQTFNDMLRTIVTRKLIDGGILIVKRYTDDGILPLALQLIEVDALAGDYMASTENGDYVSGGIEYNEYGRPQGYWIRHYLPDGFTETQPVYLPADDVIFYFTKRRPSQRREISDAASTLSRIRDVNQFIEAVAVKQRVEACLAFLIEPGEDSVPEFGRYADNDEPKPDYDTWTVTPGMFKRLGRGDKPHVINPTGQSADASSMIKTHQSLVASGQGLSYESISRDLSSTNYSSARQGAIEDEITFAEDREAVFAIIDEIYDSFVEAAVLSEAVYIRGFEANRDKYCRHEWVSRPKPWIDPLKEATAAKLALSCGIKTYQQVCAENGVDWRDNVDAIRELLDYADKKEIDLGSVIYEGKLTLPDTESVELQPAGGPETDSDNGSGLDGPAGGGEGPDG